MTRVVWAQPRFPSGVELLRLSVTVVNERGEPIRDLSAREFSVTADGKPHNVKMTVARAGATVRSRRQIVVPEEAPDPWKRLGSFLSQPVDVAELSVAADRLRSTADRGRRA